MSASRSFRRLVGVGFLTLLLLGLAVLSPLLTGRLLTSEPVDDHGALLMCLFFPTQADWVSHVLSYTLGVLLLMGAFSGIYSLVVQSYKTRRFVGILLGLAHPTREGRPARLAADLGIGFRLDIIDTIMPVAFCYGWFRPRICISSGAVAELDDREVGALLLHEHYHSLQHDPLKTSIAHLLVTTLFFLPIVKALQHQYLIAKEIEADKYVLCSQGTDRPLLVALYKLILKQARYGSKKAPSLATANAVDGINQRLDYLLNGHIPAGLSVLALFASSVMVAGVTTAVVLAGWASVASALWHQAHSGLGGC